MKSKAPSRQSGVPIGDNITGSDKRVATGTRREELRYAADAEMVVRVEHLFEPHGPLPPDEATRACGPPEQPAGPPTQDVRVAPSSASAWDARPREDDDQGRLAPQAPAPRRVDQG